MTMSRDTVGIDALRNYSEGRLSSGEALQVLRLRDHAGLLVALGDAGFPLPSQHQALVDADAKTFDTIWNAPRRP
mgnify:FL=1|jgi:hypothetical protein